MEYKWPYENETGKEEKASCDVLVLGGGIAGCYAAIAAARKGCSVILIEKGATVRSGSAGSGFDHWETACTNPGSKVTPKEIAEAFIDEQCEYSNGIAQYICCREGWDRLADMEKFGGKIRDTEDEFAGADFRDEDTKLMYAYDYKNRFTLRVWGTTFKPSLRKELNRLGVTVYDYTEATGLLTAPDEAPVCSVSGNKAKNKVVGAMGMNVRTGKMILIHAKETVLCMSRPARVWLFNPDLLGLCEFRPPQSIGSGHAMGWRAGVEFTMMEKSVPGEFSAAGRSFPPYGAGNNHNTWYAATMVDARGVEIPYVDRDGRELTTVKERYMPAPGQKFFLKGGVIDEPKYEYRGPETLPFEVLVKRGYKLPFYADLSRMPELERKVIWGMMVGQEGKTQVPILQNYTERGFDPEKHMLQSYGTGWKSATFLEQERQLFGAPGGILHDWDLKTNLNGLYAAGDQLFASDCAGFAATTGYYAGRKAAAAAEKLSIISGDENRTGKNEKENDIKGTGQNRRDSYKSDIETKEDREFWNDADIQAQIRAEEERLYAPLKREHGVHWKELNFAISKAMQNYCGGVKNEELMEEGLALLQDYEENIVPELCCDNPHDLMRTHEVLDILTVSQIIIRACLMRESGAKALFFERTDYPEMDPDQDAHFITIRQEEGKVLKGIAPFHYYGDVEKEYEKRNREYILKESAPDNHYEGRTWPAYDEAAEDVMKKSAVEMTDKVIMKESADTADRSL